jgi:predicted ABC-type ATPase
MSFYGKFVHIRKTLDYSFHKVYPKERQLLQDDIISLFLDVGKKSNRPYLILTAGAMGAGKSHTIKKVLEDAYSRFVVADVDKIKYLLPEMKEILKKDPVGAGKVLHPEACTIHEILFRESIAQRKNVIIDSSLRNGNFFRELLIDVNNTKGQTGYRTAILHVVASLDTCILRSYRRSQKTGRIVPIDSIEQSLRECPKSVALLKDLVDCVKVYHNEIDD